MELIIKPTSKCNFNCKFCSAAYMKIKTDDVNIHNELRQYIIDNKPSKIIVTGGEPLMMDPQYFYNLHDISHCPISITTNLKDFFINPSKWKDLFSESWFCIATSFQYGDGRMYDINTIYTEDMFLSVMDSFCKLTNKPVPVFISVIDNGNESKAYDHVYLAKKIGTKVKLNNMINVGKGTYYPRYKMFNIYFNIIDLGLESYEINCLERNTSKCPRSIEFKCEQCIRSVYIGNDDRLHVGVCDERLASGDEFDSVIESMKASKVLYKLNPNEYIKPECVYCELFRLCNGCKVNRLSAYNDPIYCDEMKKIKDEIIEKGWML